jgi:YbbR domain-containing protein
MQPKNSPAASAPQGQQSNWPFLVIAVLMAVVLWLFVRTGAQPATQRTILATVSVNAGGAGLVVSPPRVEVRLEGGAGALERLKAEDLDVVADLTGHREGDLVPLTVVPPQGLKVLGTNVSQVRVVRPALP